MKPLASKRGVRVNNTIHFPSGNALTIGTQGANASPIKFFNNLVIARGLQVGVTTTFPGTEFSHNLVAPAGIGQPGLGSIFAGIGGQTVSSALAVGLEDFAAGRFALAPGTRRWAAARSTWAWHGARSDAIPGSVFQQPDRKSVV